MLLDRVVDSSVGGGGVDSSSHNEGAPTPTPRILSASTPSVEGGGDSGVRLSVGAGGGAGGSARLSGGSAVVNGRPGKNSNVEAAAARASLGQPGPSQPLSPSVPSSPSGLAAPGSPQSPDSHIYSEAMVRIVSTISSTDSWHVSLY